MPRAPRRLALLLSAAFLAPLPALAADCLGMGPVGTPARLQEVDSSAAPVVFLRNGVESPGCPSDTPACRTDEQLRTGNRVVVGQVSGSFSCALHAETRAQRIAGWLPTAILTPVPETESMRPSDWAGRWRGDSDRTLRVTTGRSGVVMLRADVRGPGGDFGVSFVPEGNAARFVVGPDGTARPDQDGEATLCRMAVQRQGTFLLVQDNGRCGDASYTGLYRRGR